MREKESLFDEPPRGATAPVRLSEPLHRMAQVINLDGSVSQADVVQTYRIRAPLLANMPAIIQNWTDLTPTRRRDILRAIRAAIRIDAVPDPRLAPASVPIETATFSCGYLNSRLFRQAHTVYGIYSAETFANILSQLRFALRRLDQHTLRIGGSHTFKLSWQRLYDRLTSKHRQIALSNFMRFCSEHSVEPGMITADVLAAFETWLCERTLCRDAPIRARAVASNWTWARANVSGWPDIELTRPRMRRQYVLPFTSYPGSLQADAKRFLDRLAGGIGDIFPDAVTDKRGYRAGLTRALKPRTIAGRSFHIRQCLAALVELRHDPATLTSLRSLVDPPERAHAILTFFVERAGGQRTSQTGQIGEVLRQIARFHCKLEPEAETRIVRWSRNAAPKVIFAMSEKNTRRLQPLLDPAATKALVDLPTVLLEEAANLSLQPHEAALRALYATALNILLIFPMRRSNLASLRLDRHLNRPTGKLIESIQLDASEMKNGKPMLWPIKDKLVAKRIQTYIDRYRPHLTCVGNPYLFPQTGMKGRSGHDLAVGLKQLVEGRIGCAFNLHLIRHLTAAIHLKRHPGQYEAVRKMLGHAATSYTTDVYTPLGVDAAATLVDENVRAVGGRNKASSKTRPPESEAAPDIAMVLGNDVFRPNRKSANRPLVDLFSPDSSIRTTVRLLKGPG